MRGFLFCMLMICFALIDAGFLKAGTPLRFGDSRPYLRQVRLSGVEQFCNHYDRTRNVKTPRFLWGDEVEYGIFSRGGNNEANADADNADDTADSKSSSRADNNAEAKSAYDLSLRGAEIRAFLSDVEDKASAEAAHAAAKAGIVIDNALAKEGELGCSWMPEYGAWMVEAVPSAPYDGFVDDLFLAKKSMQLRRQRLHMALKEDELAPSMSNFPMLGVDGFRHFSGKNNPGEIANSPYIKDEIINPHPRFGTLSQNIRTRRGANVNITARRDIPLCHDEEEEQDWLDLSPARRRSSSVADDQRPALSKNEIHMDAMAFGMGCCCLQVTMQSKNEEESRYLHDQLIPLAPIFLAVSAATPAFRGAVVDTDTRWEYIGMSVDCRTDAERDVPGADYTPDPDVAGGGVKKIPNSRYSGSSAYIAKPSNDAELHSLEKLNDLNVPIDEEAYALLKERGVDEILARHIAHLFIRDPMVIFQGAIDLDNDKVTDHFENLQSTNWRTMRWKPPAVPIGFEAQRRQGVLDELKKREEAAGADTSALPTVYSGPKSSDDNEWFQHDLESFGPGWRVEFRPLELSLTDFENAAFAITIVLLSRAILKLGLNFYMPMSAVEANLARSEKKNAVLNQKFSMRRSALTPGQFMKDGLLGASDMSTVDLDCNQLFNGDAKEGFDGILPTIMRYLEAIGCDDLTKGRLRPYLDLVSKRASGELPTTAKWMREFITKHPTYKGDGNLNAIISDDLCKLCDDIGMGVKQAPELVGPVYIESLVCVTDKQAEPFIESNADKLASMKEACKEQAPYKPKDSCTDLDDFGSTGANLTSAVKTGTYLA